MKDNFSRQASLYAKYRPSYPAELFDFILDHVEEQNSAWDCATGNGQTAGELARHFKKVCATDISQRQLDNAIQADNIFYSIQSAEQTNFNDAEFDLVTVSQALHWFRFDEFYAEVKRVTRPGGWIAAWMYGLLRISPEIDQLIDEHHFVLLEKYWDVERKYVDDHYNSIPFPFSAIKCPSFEIRVEWSLEELEGYLNTWSALQKFIADHDHNPVDQLIKQIREAWTGSKMEIHFPLHLRMGRIVK